MKAILLASVVAGVSGLLGGASAQAHDTIGRVEQYAGFNAVIDLTINLMEPIIKKKNAQVSITERLSAGITVNIDAAQMQQVFSNLLMNALLSRDAGVAVQIATQRGDASSSELSGHQSRRCVSITVTDNGTGISDVDLPHVFEPFFTTREIGQGTGLGLSISHGIVSEHGGWMTVVSRLGEGTTFAVFLPVEVDL